MEATQPTRTPARRWTAEETAYLVRAYPKRLQARIARDLGRTLQSVRVKVRALIKAGTLRREDRFHEPPWKPEEVAWAKRALFHDHLPASQVADRLGRTLNGLRQRLYHAGVRCPHSGPYQGGLRVDDLRGIFGISNYRVIQAWITGGLLPARRVEWGRRKVWFVYRADLVEFLRQHPEQYDRRLMPAEVAGKPNEFRQYALPHRDPTQGYLTPKQIARLAGVGDWRVQLFCQRGLLPAVHINAPGVRAPEWYVPEAVAREWVARGRFAPGRRGFRLGKRLEAD